MKTILQILVFCLSVVTFAQEAVRVEEIKTGFEPVLYGVNDTDTTQEITITLSGLENLKGYDGPVTKQVPPKSKVEMLKLYPTKMNYTYGTSFTHKAVSDAAVVVVEEQPKLPTDDELAEGIVVFEKPGCGRCKYAVKYLIDNNIDFKKYSTGDKAVNRLMWKKLKAAGKTDRVKMPVIMVDNEISYSHTNLREFLEGLN